MKKILIISNNVLSSQNNNGKTLLSFFKDHPKSHLAQLYFSSEKLDGDYVSTSYRISDEDVLKSTFSYKEKAGTELNCVKSSGAILKNESSRIKAKKIKNSNLARLLRELVWKISSINNQGLYKWVADFNPDIIFFCAGDTLFSYDIYNAVCESFPGAQKVIYITDDYIMPSIGFSLLDQLKRKLTLNKMKKPISESDVFITISEEMRLAYKDIFLKDSIKLFNLTSDVRINGFIKTARNDLKFVYAGGLHFNRWKTLKALSEAINCFNKKNKRNVFLEIYSHQVLTYVQRERMLVEGASGFCGSLDEQGVILKLNDADVLVHVESFDISSIRATKYSISTKIAEYISSRKSILAIGPENIASMSFLEKYAVCVTSPDNIGNVFSDFVKGYSVSEVDYSTEELENMKKQFEKVVLGL